jgi:hypothetical protein
VSFGHWWIGYFIDQSGYEKIAPEFAAATARAVLPEQSQRALQAWRRGPSVFEQDLEMSEQTASQIHAYIWAFNLPGFDWLAEQLLTKGGSLNTLVDYDHVHQMIITSAHTPVSILWHALGAERASELPGQMGNLLLRADEIDEALAKVRRAYTGVSQDDLLDRARRYCSWRVEDDDLQEVFGFLPNGLARARELGRGFFSVARPQI